MEMRELERVVGADPDVDAKMADKEGFERRKGRLRSEMRRLLRSAAFSGDRMRGIDNDVSE